MRCKQYAKRGTAARVGSDDDSDARTVARAGAYGEEISDHQIARDAVSVAATCQAQAGRGPRQPTGLC